jgi:hypothetical protein
MQQSPTPKTNCGPFSKKGPDVMTEQLAVVLSSKTSFEFKALFETLYTNMKGRNLANGGEEMMRLRAYEKLQALVNRGMVEKRVTKKAKTYRGLAALSSALPKRMTGKDLLNLDVSIPEMPGSALVFYKKL